MDPKEIPTKKPEDLTKLDVSGKEPKNAKNGKNGKNWENPDKDVVVQYWNYNILL